MIIVTSETIANHRVTRTERSDAMKFPPRPRLRMVTSKTWPMETMSEIVAYGTAVQIEPIEA